MNTCKAKGKKTNPLRLVATLMYHHSHINQVAIFTGGRGRSPLEWREVNTGHLPTARQGLRATVIENHIYVTGGFYGESNHLTEILHWDPSIESWQQFGNLTVGRACHAAVAISSSIIR